MKNKDGLNHFNNSEVIYIFFNFGFIFFLFGKQFFTEVIFK